MGLTTKYTFTLNCPDQPIRDLTNLELIMPQEFYLSNPGVTQFFCYSHEWKTLDTSTCPFKLNAKLEPTLNVVLREIEPNTDFKFLVELKNPLLAKAGYSFKANLYSKGILYSQTDPSPSFELFGAPHSIGTS